MGILVNPDNLAFQVALNSEIYVDKSGLIKYTNKVLNTLQAIFAIAVREGLENLLQRICLQLITAEAVIQKKCSPDWKLVKVQILRST